MENSLDSAPGADCKIQEEKKELLEREILQKLAIQETLTHLTIEEHSDVTKLADAIEPRSTYVKEKSRKKLSLRRKWMIVLLIVVILFGWFGIAGGTEAIWICMMAKNIRRPLVMVLFKIAGKLEKRFLLRGKMAGKSWCIFAVETYFEKKHTYTFFWGFYC